MPAELRVALIGAGRMGTNHARVLAGMTGARLVGVYDGVADRADALAANHGCVVLRSLEEVRGTADAAIIAVSSSAHAEIGLQLLSDGVPSLIEKPLAIDEAQCRALIAAAKKAGVPLAVGHVERFNPAVRAAADLLAGEKILALEARRLNPGSTRIQDTDVVIDLMVHDIDTVRLLLGAEPIRIEAQGVAVAQPDMADHAMAHLAFADGAAASLVASRISQIRVRSLTAVCEHSTVILDYLEQAVSVVREGADGPEILRVEKASPLERELTGFLAAVEARSDAQIVAPGEALADLAIAWAIQHRLAAVLPGGARSAAIR